jgi:hypothetical protein
VLVKRSSLTSIWLPFALHSGLVRLTRLVELCLPIGDHVHSYILRRQWIIINFDLASGAHLSTACKHRIVFLGELIHRSEILPLYTTVIWHIL